MLTKELVKRHEAQCASSLLAMAGVSDDDEKRLVFERGIEFIAQNYDSYPSRRAVEKSRLFWGFWELQWRIRNSQLAEQVATEDYHFSRKEVLAEWQHIHDIDTLMIDGSNHYMREEFFRLTHKIKTQ